MRVVVEFFGVVRRRAGVAQFEIEFAGDDPRSLLEVFDRLAQQFGDLSPDCVIRDESNGWALTAHVIANINGQRFTRSGASLLSDGDRLLLLTADVGG